jgi:hypothetical protein
MSWDVAILRFDGSTPASLEEYAEAQTRVLGPASEVRDSIGKALPGIDWSDKTWGIYNGDGFSIEFNMGKEDVIKSITLHVRGEGNAIAAIMAVVKPLGWSALDCSTSEFLDSEQPSQEGWKEFQEYRDKAFGKNRPNA